jgi:amidophosphoribosyltransferase
VEEVARAIGADWLIYQDIEDLIDCVRTGNPALHKFETCCFTGQYVTGDVSPQYLNRLGLIRNDKVRQLPDAEELEDVGIG